MLRYHVIIYKSNHKKALEEFASKAFLLIDDEHF